MAITINGSGTITGVSAGGLPDGCVDNDTIATGVSASKLTGTLPALDGSSLTGIASDYVLLESWYASDGAANQVNFTTVFSDNTDYSYFEIVCDINSSASTGDTQWNAYFYKGGTLQTSGYYGVVFGDRSTTSQSVSEQQNGYGNVNRIILSQLDISGTDDCRSKGVYQIWGANDSSADTSLTGNNYIINQDMSFINAQHLHWKRSADGETTDGIRFQIYNGNQFDKGFIKIYGVK